MWVRHGRHSFWAVRTVNRVCAVDACRGGARRARCAPVVRATESPTAAVAELQGLYGAFSFPEKLCRRSGCAGISIAPSSSTADGRAVRVVHPGKWNLLGGPDFTGARLRFGDSPEREVTGDVEVHLRATDWDRAWPRGGSRLRSRRAACGVCFPWRNPT